jgi:alpha/beta superfamily hydrolase
LDQAHREPTGQAALPQQSVVLAGFSFGSMVVTRLATRLSAANTPAQRLILVGTATSRWSVDPVPADTLVIHGENDEVVPLSTVLDWARPQELPVVVIPGADHFFHRRLTVIKRLVRQAWGRPAPGL